MNKPLAAISASTLLLLGACGTDNTIPPANETPMEDVREDTQEMVPDMSPNGTDVDRDVLDDEADNRDDISPTNEDTNKDMMKDPNTNEEDVMEDDIDMKDKDNKDE